MNEMRGAREDSHSNRLGLEPGTDAAIRVKEEAQTRVSQSCSAKLNKNWNKVRVKTTAWIGDQVRLEL